MQKKISLIFSFLVVILVGLAFYNIWLNKEAEKISSVQSFEECSLYFSVMESYPRQCRTPDGRLFVEEIDEPISRDNFINITEPVSGDVVKSPFMVRGEARGSWYFEASFPIELQTLEGEILDTVPASALSDWMTEEFVPFEAELSFSEVASGTPAVLIFRRDNPSGLPENDASTTISIIIGE